MDSHRASRRERRTCTDEAIHFATRQFQRAFVLANGVEIRDANLENGLLTIDLERPEPERIVRRIEIKGA